MTKLQYKDPQVTAWENTTTNLLHDVYGKPNGDPHSNTWDFEHASGGPMFVNMDDEDLQGHFQTQQGQRKALLAAYIEQLTDDIGGPQALTNAIDLTEGALSRLRTVLPRFHKFARQLLRRHANRPTVKIEDEYDVQDLLHALLKLEFDDIRAEEWAPSSAGQSTRMDFLLKTEKVVVEIKKTRKGLADKELGSELIQDIARYRVHPDCKVLVCFIYDPEGIVLNGPGLIADLKRLGSSELAVEVIISPAD